MKKAVLLIPILILCCWPTWAVPDPAPVINPDEFIHSLLLRPLFLAQINGQNFSFDASGYLNVNCQTGCSGGGGGGGTSSNFSAAFPTAGTAAGASDGANMQPLLVDGSGNLKTVFSNSTIGVTGTFWQATQPVSGTFFQATQPISGAISFTAPQHTILDSGTLTSITNPVAVTGTFWPYTLGQQVAADSVPVVLTAAQMTTLTPLTTVAVTQSTSPWVVSNSGTFAVQGTDTVTGNVASGGADSGNPVKTGCVYNTSAVLTPLALQAGQRGDTQCDQYGRELVVDPQISTVQAILQALLIAQKNIQLRGTFGESLRSINGALTVSPVQTDPCSGAKQSIAISQTGNTRYVVGGGHRTFICSIIIVGADAENVSLVEGTGTTCGTNTIAVIGGASAANGPNMAANGGFSMGNGGGTVAGAGVSGDDVCLFESGSGRVAGVMTVAFGQ